MCKTNAASAGHPPVVRHKIPTVDFATTPDRSGSRRAVRRVALLGQTMVLSGRETTMPTGPPGTGKLSLLLAVRGYHRGDVSTMPASTSATRSRTALRIVSEHDRLPKADLALPIQCCWREIIAHTALTNQMSGLIKSFQ